MRYPALAFFTLVVSASAPAFSGQQQKRPLPSFNYEEARGHELKPHRRTFRLPGVRPGASQIRLTLTVSPLGDVVNVAPSADPETLKFWPQVQSEVRNWKFTPFARDGKPTAAEVEEYAGRFVAADFYSMDAAYRAPVTDNPTYTLAISIDGRKKEVEDCVGEWEGIPSVIFGTGKSGRCLRQDGSLD